MAEKPSDYDIKRQFINELSSVISTCITDYGYTAKGYDIEDLLQVSKQVKDAQQYVAKQHPHAAGTGQSAYKQVAAKPNNNAVATTAAQSNTKVVRYNGGHGPNKNHHNTSQPYGNTRPQDKPSHRPMAKYPAIAGPSKISASAVMLPPKGKPMDIAALTCFLCGRPGHLARNCRYPPNQWAAAGEIAPADDHDGVPYDGGQYDADLISVEDFYDPVTKVTPNESDTIYDMPEGTIESLDPVEDLTTYIENNVENEDGELRDHAGMLIPWENNESTNEAITREFNAVTTAIGPNLVFRSRAC